MRAVIQRVSQAHVLADGQPSGSIGQGVVVLIGVHKADSESDCSWLADKIAHLRIFEDQEGRMNRSLLDTGGQALIVSQFTLHGDCRKGRRPSWNHAAPPEHAKILYQRFIELIRSKGIDVQTGVFGASMELNLVNHGPVTLLLDSHKQF